ncbi:MAG TPA: PTS sugar transporter subunit IIC [Longimicrobiales bacterium]
MMTWLATALWGAAVGLDATSFPQVMISRPLIAGAITGLLVGRPTDGIIVGALLELFSLGILPVGAARYPEAGTAAVAASMAYATAAARPEAHLLLLAVVFGLGWERVAGLSVTVLRRVNERLVTAAAARPPGAPRLERTHLTAMALDVLRGAAVAVVGAFLGTLLLRLLGPFWALGPGVAAGVLAVAGAAMAGAGFSLFGGANERRIALGLGILCGCAFLLAR